MRLYFAVSILLSEKWLLGFPILKTLDSSLIFGKIMPMLIQPKQRLYSQSQWLIMRKWKKLTLLKLFIMSKVITEYLQNFRREIRKLEIEEMKARRRRQLEKQISKSQLISYFQLHSKPSIITSIQSIFEHCEEILLNPFPHATIIADQKYLIGINCHINFYREISESTQLYTITSDIINIVQKLLSKYSSKQVSQRPQYQLQLYNLIDSVIDDLSQNFRRYFLQWVSTKESMPTIQKMISEFQSITIQDYPNIFQIILEGFNASDQSCQTEATLLLTKIIKYLDKKDIFQIHEKFFKIPEKIINIISNKLDHSEPNLIKFWTPLLYLFNTFDQAVINYSTTGIIRMSGAMIATNEESNIFGGILLLSSLCQIRNGKLIDHLLFDQDLIDSKMWLLKCLQNKIYSHCNLGTRKCFAQLIKRVIKQLNTLQLQQFSQKFIFKTNKLLAYFQQSLSSEKQADIHIFILQCIEKLLFNANEQHLATIIILLEQSNILNFINFLQSHNNSVIRQICGDLLERMEEIRRKQAIDEI